MSVLSHTFPLRNVRFFMTSHSMAIREIVRSEEPKKTVIEGASKPSPRTNFLIDPKIFPVSGCEANDECHPLCRFDKVHEIKHSDVLILEQFVDSDGEQLPRSLTKLCKRQHYRIGKLVGMAQKAGLMGSKDR